MTPHGNSPAPQLHTSGDLDRRPAPWPTPPGPGTLLLVRHGESEGNAAMVFSGSQDHALTARGREQAIALGNWFAATLPGLRLAGVFTSTLSRACETAALLLGVWQPAHPPPIALPDLGERRFGALEGEGRANPQSRQALEDPYFRPADGESLADAEARAVAEVDAHIRPVLASGPVLLVAHGGINRGVVRRTLGLTWREALALPMGNCQLYRLTFPSD